jgi:hypothetical protein
VIKKPRELGGMARVGPQRHEKQAIQNKNTHFGKLLNNSLFYIFVYIFFSEYKLFVSPKKNSSNRLGF